MIDIFRSYENITKNENELLEIIKKIKYSQTKKINYYNELVKRERKIDKQLYYCYLLINYLVEKIRELNIRKLK